MLLGAIADDFTGASDLANTLARGGMAVTQLVGVPQMPAPDAMEAAVVSLKTRSIAPAEAVRQSLQALAWLESRAAANSVQILLHLRTRPPPAISGRWPRP